MKDDPQATSPLSWIIKVEQKFLYSAFHSGLTHQQHARLFPVLMEIHRYKGFLPFHLRMTYGFVLEQAEVERCFRILYVLECQEFLMWRLFPPFL